MTKQIIVRVHDDGTVEAETVGMHGPECLDYFAVLEDMLDAETTASTYTEDFHRTAAGTGVDDATRDTVSGGS